MIPTTATSSPCTAASAAAAAANMNNNNNSNHNNNNNNNTNGQQHNSSSVMIGIASLILEGRAISEDEYQQPKMSAAAFAAVAASANLIDGDLTSFYSVGNIPPSGSSNYSTSGRQSPIPSTSRASGSGINITTNPSNAFSSVTTPLFINPHSHSSTVSTADSTYQRWTQKLCQLRQASPAASFSSIFEQILTVDSRRSKGDPELVALAISESSGEGGAYEIVRRELLHRNNATPTTTNSASSSPGAAAAGIGSCESEMYSLQSLATTCLRSGSPTVDAGYAYTPLLSTTPIASPGTAATNPPKYNYRATPPRFQSPYSMNVPCSASSSGSGIQSPRPSWSSSATPSSVGAASGSSSAVHSGAKEKFLRQSASGRVAVPGSTIAHSTAKKGGHAMKLGASPKVATATSGSAATTYPTQGPHCDQFLKKMGLAKGEAAEAPDHSCDTSSFVNIICSRWRAHCSKMDTIIEKGEPVCIEVYLGPASHNILLEQWIITRKEKVPPPTMTMPSLCSAIRSQLYFSQISAWCDLIKKSDKTIYDSGRVIFPTTTGAAGDLATSSSPPNANSTPGSSPNPNSPPFAHFPSAMFNKPRLNIYYRIKVYDSTANFNSKPNIHNFPSVNVSENSSISVSLKSLPRINGGIPKIGSSILSICAEGPSVNNGAGAGVDSSSNGAIQKPKASQRAVEVNVTSSSQQMVTTSQAAEKKAAFHNCDTKPAQQMDTTGSSGYCSSTPPKEKHKCLFFIDEDELPDGDGDGEGEGAEEDTDGGDTDGNSSDFVYRMSDNSNSPGGQQNLTHREKQLMKYRKRMLKRDKKHRKPFSNASDASTEAATSELQSRKRNYGRNTCQPMEQGEEEDHSQQQQQQETTNKRSTTSATTAGGSAQIQMISTGTQTPMSCCQQCGNLKTLVCLKCKDNIEADACEPLLFSSFDDMDDSSSSLSSLSSGDAITTPRTAGDMLLLAIQRSAKAAKSKKQPIRSVTTVSLPSISQSKLQNNNHLNSAALSGGANSKLGCPDCKRQKTQHNFAISSNAEKTTEGGEIADGGADDEDDDGGKGFDECDKIRAKGEITQEETFRSTTKLSRINDRCIVSTLVPAPKSPFELVVHFAEEDLNLTPMRSTTPPTSEQHGKPDKDCLACCTATNFHKANEFKTPVHEHQQSPHQQQQQQQQQQKKSFHFNQRKQTPKPNLLQIKCSYNNSGTDGDEGNTLGNGFSNKQQQQQNSLLLRKGLPKVNLTPLFCNPTGTITASQSSPIPISCVTAPDMSSTFSFDTAAIKGAGQLQLTHTTAVDNNIPVQKSFSAPTLPNSPSLSPRFAKQAAIYKRRSRHLSDRSDRSSLGSDEQFSDEDVEVGMFPSPATSPMKSRWRINAAFARRPFLGNLEESLLQKRLLPKIEVMGFKVLLGASGGFCPTQLTLPAASYFYEMHGGEALSTPYLCEVRLPRKGYYVPRTGTIQATLLNPMGTVVRMFVIPYDMRDMPPLHQTFIRHRILAEASTNETIAMQNHTNNNNEMITGNETSAGNQANQNGNGNSNNNNNSKYYLSPSGGLHGESNLGHFISPEHMKRLRYSIHLRFQTSRSGRLLLHTDIRILISRRTDCDTAAAHAKGVLEAPNDLVTDTVMPANPKYSARQETSSNSNKI